ncbi:MAG: glycosyltransferase [Oscillospiraceae bacterium]|nr:glycosyltransferase [Oscillospiraceae bacterium]
MRKRRILEVNKLYAPHIGGIETVVRQRTRYLAARPDTEVHVLVCQPKGAGETERLDGAEVIRCGSLGTWCSCPVSAAFFSAFWREAAWADVMDIHMPFPPADLALLLSQFPGRVVVNWHSDVLRQKALLPLYRPVLHRMLQRADVILAATQGHVDSSDFLPAFREKCRILPYPLDADAYPQKPARPVLHPRNPYSVKLLFVGRLVYYKGVECLLEAMRQVQGCELFLCGTGMLEEKLRHQAAGLPVQFLGSLSSAELRDAFADCDMFILPSTERTEAFGIVQQEAMACGKPVINTALPGGVPYVSIHGQTGLTVPPGDADALAKAIRRLAADTALRRRFGENGRLRVREQYAPERIYPALFRILRRG